MQKLIDDPDMPILEKSRLLSRYLLNKYRGLSVINKDTGYSIGVYRNGLESSLKNRKPMARRLYAILPQMLEHAVLMRYEENIKRDGKPGVAGYETYVVPVEIDGKRYSARLLVDVVKNEARGRGYYYHQVEEAALGAPVGSTRAQPDAERLASTPGASGGVTLGQIVGNNKPIASNVVDENGEPFGREGA